MKLTPKLINRILMILILVALLVTFGMVFHAAQMFLPGVK